MTSYQIIIRILEISLCLYLVNSIRSWWRKNSSIEKIKPFEPKEKPSKKVLSHPKTIGRPVAAENERRARHALYHNSPKRELRPRERSKAGAREQGIMEPYTIQGMSDHYRLIRKAVFEEATEPIIISKERHTENKNKLKYKIIDICKKAHIELYKGNERSTAGNIWHHLWTKNRYAGIKAQIATKEIQDIESIFDQFEIFSNPSWNIEATGHEIIQAGKSVNDFLNRTGIFQNRQTIGNIPKLCKIVSVARQLKKFMDSKLPNNPVLDFITGGYSENDVWAIHAHLMDIGYKSDLTVLHFLMDMGFQVIKPDIIISRLFLEWGWLHRIVENLPEDLSFDDLEGKGKFGSRFKYTKAIIYKPIIELAKKITEYTNQGTLKEDIGWVTNNPLREFDIFVVKYGQQPESDFGITKTLFKGTQQMIGNKRTCVTQ